MATRPTVSSARNSTNVRTLTLAPRLFRAAARGVQVAAPPLAPALAEALFRWPRRFATPGRERGWIAEATRATVAFDGERLPVLVWGSGPTVLLAHGWEGRGSQMGALGRAVAAAGMRAVAWDAPAHGGSRRRLSSLPQFTGALAAVASAYGPVLAAVGHSFGGAAACWAIARGLRVERLVLIAAPADLDSYVAWFAAALGFERHTMDGMVDRIARRFRLDWQVARRPAFAAAERQPSLPVLVVHDAGDEETPWRDGEAVAAAWPRGELLTTRGLGHRRILHAPEVLAAVAGFVAGGAGEAELPSAAALG